MPVCKWQMHKIDLLTNTYGWLGKGQAMGMYSVQMSLLGLSMLARRIFDLHKEYWVALWYCKSSQTDRLSMPHQL